MLTLKNIKLYLLFMNKQIPKNIHAALVKKYEAQISMAKANLAVYENNMVGIGEHQILAETIEDEYKKLDEAISMLDTLKAHPLGN